MRELHARLWKISMHCFDVVCKLVLDHHIASVHGLNISHWYRMRMAREKCLVPVQYRYNERKIIIREAYRLCLNITFFVILAGSPSINTIVVLTTWVSESSTICKLGQRTSLSSVLKHNKSYLGRFLQICNEEYTYLSSSPQYEW